MFSMGGGWYSRRVQNLVDALQKNTFAPGAIAMAQFDGMTAAVPVDGWTHGCLPQGSFDSKGLAAPTSYAAIEAAVDALTIRHQCMVCGAKQLMRTL